MEFGDPIKAEVTWNGSKSYRFAGNSTLLFKEGKTRTIEDTEIIKRCQNTAGFSVRVLKSYDRPISKNRSRKAKKKLKPKKTIRPVVKGGSAKKTKKKTKKK